MTLSKRKLSRQGLEVSAIGLGCMGMSQSYGPADEMESIATLHRAIELGCTFLDTAEVYGPFANEELVGHLPTPRRFGRTDRRCGWDGRRSHPGGQGALLRPLRGRRRQYPLRPCRAPGFGAAERRSYLEENVAAEAIRLDAVEMSALDESLGLGKVAGPRYPEWIMATIDR